MSYDFAFETQTCDHVITCERYVIDQSDFRTFRLASNPTIYMRAPINAPSVTRIYFHGVLLNPTDPIYGYSFIPDPNKIYAGYNFYRIIFNQPVRLLNPLIEVTYITRKQFCIRCGGVGTVTDWEVEGSGSLVIANKADKLAQQVFKYILTSKNPFNPNLVCPIKSYIGQKISSDITTATIAQAVTQILQTYQSIQRAQSTIQNLDPQEMLQSIQSVIATKSPTDPTMFNVQIMVSTFGTSQPIPINLLLQTQQS